jgi:hypothetical protein
MSPGLLDDADANPIATAPVGVTAMSRMPAGVTAPVVSTNSAGFQVTPSVENHAAAANGRVSCPPTTISPSERTAALETVGSASEAIASS